MRAEKTHSHLNEKCIQTEKLPNDKYLHKNYDEKKFLSENMVRIRVSSCFYKKSMYII
jgi:hypothetical protein